MILNPWKIQIEKFLVLWNFIKPFSALELFSSLFSEIKLKIEPKAELKVELKSLFVGDKEM